MSSIIWAGIGFLIGLSLPAPYEAAVRRKVKAAAAWAMGYRKGDGDEV